MIRISTDVNPSAVHTFFNDDDARDFLRADGAVNGISGWHRRLRGNESGRYGRDYVSYNIRDERGWTVRV